MIFGIRLRNCEFLVYRSPRQPIDGAGGRNGPFRDPVDRNGRVGPSDAFIDRCGGADACGARGTRPVECATSETRGTRSVGCADRALSGSTACPSVDGVGLSARHRASRAVAGSEQNSQRRSVEGGGRQTALGRQHQILGRDAGRAADDEQQARLDAKARRCGCCPAGRCDGRHPAPAQQGSSQQQAAIDQRAENHCNERTEQASHCHRADRP